ncbi:hypothetical protein [Streptomyces aureus]|uniref:hypothetical protein n=1 Tax=Streptomyces aureus TaxID=193461 RepID=UPI000A825D3E|nr:hypothetical protein [Streptomyces aureus]
MTEQSEEVKRLLEALAAFEAIEDPAARTTAVSQALKDWPTYHARLRELRQASVRELRDEQQKTWPEIASIIGEVTPERAQQIGKGLRGSKRPPKKTDDASEK